MKTILVDLGYHDGMCSECHDCEHLASLGMPGDRIMLVPYRPDWPAMFEREVMRIREACGTWIVDVEHIGSTAVPGLAAKPILDIMPSVASIDHAKHCIKPMEQLGYKYFGEFGIPGRAFFVLSYENRRVVHVHMYATRCSDWRRHIHFRNALRRDSGIRQEYVALKRALVDAYAHDGDGYSKGKSEFIRAMTSFDHQVG